MARTRGIEQFLARALECFRDHTGEHGHNAGAKHAAADADCHPSAAAGNATRGSQDNADNQAGLDDFSKDNDKCAEHDLFRDHHTFSGGFMIFADECVATWLEGADTHHAF